MTLKAFLKYIKLSQPVISMLVGALTVIILGYVILSFFQNKKEGEIIPPVGTEETSIKKLPAFHTVKANEDLWKISEKYYGTGYNWSDIARFNSLKNPNDIKVGQILNIPNITPKISSTTKTTITPTPVSTVTPTKTIFNTPTPVIPSAFKRDAINSDKYVVVKGDCLWNIAVKAYGDGFKWKEIAKFNKLDNPSLIHPGNVFIIPR